MPGPLAAIVATPVQRRLDCVLAHPGPAVRQPQARRAVAPVIDEVAPFAVGDQAIRKRMRREPHRMARPLAVEGEVSAIVPDIYRTPAPLGPAQGIGCGGARNIAGRVGSRKERVLGEQMKEVGEKQLLMLLLMIAPEQDEALRRRRQVVERLHYGDIDMPAIRQDLVERRAGQHPARWPRDAVPLGFVIAVVEEGERGIERTIASDKVAQHKRLEEPRRVRQVPFTWRGVRHRLDADVCVRQPIDKRDRNRTHAIETPPQTVRGWRQRQNQLAGSDIVA